MTAGSTILGDQGMRPCVPRLENGDRLTRAEFERRYSAMPETARAELIEGIVYLNRRVQFTGHGVPHARLTGWLGRYLAATPDLEHYGANVTVRLDEDNEPQPDLCLLLPKAPGGLAHVDEDDYIVGPPTLACEIAASTVSIDLHAKLNAYRRNGVREYLVWRTDDAAVDWLCAFDQPLLLPANLTRHHAGHLEVRHGCKADEGCGRLA